MNDPCHRQPGSGVGYGLGATASRDRGSDTGWVPPPAGIGGRIRVGCHRYPGSGPMDGGFALRAPDRAHGRPTGLVSGRSVIHLPWIWVKMTMQRSRRHPENASRPTASSEHPETGQHPQAKGEPGARTSEASAGTRGAPRGPAACATRRARRSPVLPDPNEPGISADQRDRRRRLLTTTLEKQTRGAGRCHPPVPEPVRPRPCLMGVRAMVGIIPRGDWSRARSRGPRPCATSRVTREMGGWKTHPGR
jgi:hypothetical protein